MRAKIKLFLRVAKAPLCLMVGFSTALGYLLANPFFSLDLYMSSCGVFFLACGAASINSIQEKDADACYKRTRNRPVATGKVSPKAAALFAIINCTIGLSLLVFCGNALMPFFLGLAALGIYNVIYTPLKPISELAILPGTVSGVFPPFIGWISGHGQLFDPLIWTVMALFFLWQPPHFCLILLEYTEDGHQKHRFRNLVTRFTVKKVKKIIAIWLLAFLTIVLSLTALPGYLSQGIRFILAAGAPVFVTVFLIHLFLDKNPRYKMLFVSLNGFMFSIMVLLTFSSIMETI